MKVFPLKASLALLSLLLLMSVNCLAQDNKTNVSGYVTDSLGNPLVGSTIKAVDAQSGTLADEKGHFELYVNKTDTIVFSHLGYLKKSVPAHALSMTSTIILYNASENLDEVVVIGYGTARKKDLTGSVLSLNAKDFNKGVVTSPDQLIAGKAAGVQVVRNSGEPGGGISVNIRGVGSINAGNSPLYVVDGLPLDNSSTVSGSGTSFTGMKTPRNPLNSINPNDIASIDVLKDASATAIYGSRGANGVVLITTKSGKAGSLNTNYSVYTGVQNVAHNINLLNATQYKDVMNDLIDLGGGDLSQKIDSISKGGTNWLDQVYHKNAFIQNHNLSLSGGNEKTTFLVSLNYYNQNGILINSDNKRYAARVNLVHRASDRFKIGLNFSSSYVADNYVPNGMDLNERAGIIYAAINYDPTLSLYDENGKYTLSKDMNIDNPLAIANGKKAHSNLYRTFGTVYGEYNITHALTAKINLGTDVVNQRRDTYISRLTIDGGAANGIASILNGKNSNYLFEGTMTYKKQFGQSALNAVAGITGQRFIEDASNEEARGFPSDEIGTNNLGLGDPSTAVNGSSKSQNSLLSYLGRVNYRIADKYLLTATMRIDGSSRFGINNKYGYFPSLGLGWNINDEGFLKNIQAINLLKLRASWGETGNQEIGNYQSVSTFSTGYKAVFDGTQYSSVVPARIANPDLKWETSEQLNIGIDYGFFDNRLSGSLEWYSKTTKDMLLSLPIPRSTGFSTMLTNIGSMRNSGFEFMLATQNIKGAHFNWNSNVSVSTLKNTVLDLGGIDEIISGSAGSTSQIALTKVGEPVNSFYGYITDGIWQTADDFSSTLDNVTPGDLKFRDINGDSTVDANDRSILGNSFPTLSWSFSNDLSYRNFSLNLFIEGIHGAKMLNNNLVDTYFPANLKRNRLAEPLLNRWTEQNPSNKYPSFVHPNAQGGKTVNSYTVEDASYIRLNTVQLSYNIPLKSNRVLRSASVYISGQNLVTITDYTGYDPALNPYGGANFRIDWNAYPSARTFLLGLNLVF